MNFELKVKEITKETYILTSKINDKDIINNLIKSIKECENSDLNYKTNVKGVFTGFKSLIKNVYFVDFLKIIQPSIRVIYAQNFMIEDAWGNICKKGDEVIEHDHGSVSGFCGILYLTEDGPGTYFKEYDLTIKEEIGKFILFSPILQHNVKKIEKDIERITLAFNMNQVKEWTNLSDVAWVNKNEI